MNENGVSYRGPVAVTITNRTCQRWDSQAPHQHRYTPASYPSSGLEGNYCRNPSGDPAVWCYTADPAERWGYCDVPFCGQWGAWGSWAACSAPCGFDLQTRRRVCDNPNPPPAPNVTCEGQTEGAALCYVPPACPGGMDVASTVYILNIGTLSEKHANISLRLQYTLTWADSRLYGIAPSWVPVPPSLVWSPPLAFGQSVRRVTAEEEADTSMWLDPRGIVIYKMTRSLTLSCVAKLERYPLDTQDCQVVLHAYNGIRLRLQPSETGQNAPIKVDARGIKSQFVLVGAEQKAGFKFFRENVTDCGFFKQTCDYHKEACMTSLSDTCKGTACANCDLVVGDCRQQPPQSCAQHINDTSAYTSLEVNIRLRRVLWRHILTDYLPSTVIVLAAFLQTWLPLTLSTVSARVVLGTTSVLSMILQAGKTEQMPWVDSPRAIDIWMFGCLSLVIVALLQTAVVHYISTYIQKKVVTAAGTPGRLSVRVEVGLHLSDDASSAAPSRSPRPLTLARRLPLAGLAGQPRGLDCQVDNGRFYGGTTAVTSTGRTCQRWDSQTPHQHTWTHANHPTSRLEENYCRNPDPTNRVQPWCLTTDPGPVREKCEVPPCVCTSKTTDDGYWYRWDSLLITSPYLFLVQAGSDVHIGLASSNGDLDATYEFVIGGWGNLRSAIRRVPQGANMISHTTVEWTDPDPRPVSYIGYSTGFGHTGLWQLCEGGMDVASTVYILHIGTLSEKHANISVRLQYTLTWGESRLYGIAPSWVPVPPSLVWSPPLAFGQSVRRVTAEEEADTSMWLDPRGLVVYKMTYCSYTIILKSACCVAKLERYPLDTQECQVVLHAYNGIRLRLQPSETGQNAPIKVDARGIVSQFVLVGAEQKAGFKSFRENVSDTSAYTSLEVNIRLRRVLWRHILTDYLPSTVIVLAAFLQTWLPLTLATVSARVVLGTTSVLSMILQAGKTEQMPWVG
uniref:Kringle domain-containing protein n=1 Tax=Branchiostoma floridae TaxID=7739 RepID=C3Y567_BRAFL|eukprot:XP_002608590.1 hypothetical protein BRAFLDRAFT_96117 [Branchiostoma floridae]